MKRKIAMEEEAVHDEQMVEDESDSGSSMEEDELDDNIKIPARELQQALLEEEKKGTQMNQIKELWSLAEPIIKDSSEGVSLFTTYIYLLRRLGASVDELKAVFLEGKTLLSSMFGKYWDENAKFRQNFAYFLYTKAKQPDEALNLWKDILASGWESDPYQWIEASRLERHFGDVENARSLLYKGINARLNEPYDFFDYFLQFEREEGTREQVDLALEKINAASSRLQQQPIRNKQQRKDNQKDRNKAGNKPGNKKQNDRPQKRRTDQNSENFKKPVEESKAEKNGSSSTAKPVKDADGFVIPSIQPKRTIGFSLTPRILSNK